MEQHSAAEAFHVKLAGRVVRVEPLNGYVREYCKDYLVPTSDKADFTVTTLPDELRFERDKSAREDLLEGIAPRQFSDAYLETLSVYRKIAEEMLQWDTLLFHGSAIALDGAGYLFTAKSGTGKSTHTRLWRERFGARAVMVNDDKPLLKLTDTGVYVCGTPWDGKHRLSSNQMVPLRAICILERGAENQIEPITPREAFPLFLQQSYRPAKQEQLVRVLELVERLTKQVNIYRLHCNMNPEAAEIAYNGMKGTK